MLFPSRAVTAGILLSAVAPVPAAVVRTTCRDSYPVRVLDDDNAQVPFVDDPFHNKPHRNGKIVRPNFVFILTDDQDVQSLEYMPMVQKHLRARGTFFRNHFASTPLGTPSRASLWTGKLAHNTNVKDEYPPYGGYEQFVSEGFDEDYLPTWLQSLGYNTYYAGHFLSSQSVSDHACRPSGWTSADILLASRPGEFSYLNATFRRNDDAPISYEGRHVMEVLSEKSYSQLDAAIAGVDDALDPRPFFVAVSPVAPHAEVEFPAGTTTSNGHEDPLASAAFGAPVPLPQHALLFPDAAVPRTPDFNPATPPTAASWVDGLPTQPAANVAHDDEFFRRRLRSLRAVDDLVAGVVARLAPAGLLGSTYVVYAGANGYHVGQHRMQPGKGTGYRSDANVPLLVRGPGVPSAREVAGGLVTSVVDIAPTVLGLVQSSIVDGTGDEDVVKAAERGFDGVAIPLTGKEIADAYETRHEHALVEHWGLAVNEGSVEWAGRVAASNNTFAGVRVLGKGVGFYYAVWCDGQKELYDLRTDHYELRNLLHPSLALPPSYPVFIPTLGRPVALSALVARLDALLSVLQTCTGTASCTRPWATLHPAGDVANLRDALSPALDGFYEQRRLGGRNGAGFASCERGAVAVGRAQWTRLELRRE